MDGWFTLNSFYFMLATFWSQMELQFSQDSEHGNVGLPCTNGSTNQEVLISVVGLVVHYGLGFVP